MKNITITQESLMEAIQAAFDLGKTYAGDELESCGIETPAGRFKGGQSRHERQAIWEAWIESKGGTNLHSGDAKTDIVMAAVMKSVKFEDLIPMVRGIFQMD